MNKKLKRYTEEDRARAFSASSTPAVGAKGTKDNPYTQEEFEAMLEAGTWNGGYVSGMGYVAPTHTVTPGSGSSSYGEDDNWYCPNCGLPYPTDAGSDYVKCSQCGTSIDNRHPSPIPGSESSGSGSGGSGNWNGGNAGKGTGNTGGDRPNTSTIQYVSANKIQYNNLSSEEINEVKSFYSTETLNQALIDFLSKSSGLTIELVSDLNVGGLYIGNGKILLVKTEDNRIDYSALFEETVHFIQDEIGIMEQEVNKIGHSNIEYQAKISAYLLSTLQKGKNFEWVDLQFDDDIDFIKYLTNSTDTAISLSEFETKAQTNYQQFLQYYSQEEHYHEAYSQYDGGDNWNWRWQDLLETMGFNLIP